ncbi:hypothetical protein [Microbacterium sp. SLBN-111]|uniref:hypothetical protein n=1 Tax=Microbacterium sp. SLBN-111 TaxID=3377733 RepID=UPI003C782D67
MEEHISGLGWKNLGDTTGLQADGVGTSSYYIGRAWSPTGLYEGIPEPGAMYAFITIEGGGTLTYDGTSMDVSRDHMVFMNAEADITIHLSSASARYLWKLKPTVLNNPLVRERIGEPLPVGPEVWKIAGALTNSALEADSAVTTSGYFANASENLLAAVFETVRQPARLVPSSRPDLVYGEAMHVIEQRYNDVALTPTTIAAEVLVSERTLRRAFAAMGTTPRTEIERRRVRELNDLLKHFGVTRAFEHLSEMSGFSSARQARSALRRV